MYCIYLLYLRWPSNQQFIYIIIFCLSRMNNFIWAWVETPSRGVLDVKVSQGSHHIPGRPTQQWVRAVTVAKMCTYRPAWCCGSRQLEWRPSIYMYIMDVYVSFSNFTLIISLKRTPDFAPGFFIIIFRRIPIYHCMTLTSCGLLTWWKIELIITNYFTKM